MKLHPAVKLLLCLVAVLVLIVASYIIYLFVDYKRIEDHLPLTVANNQSDPIPVGKSFKLVSWNIGFGAYDQFLFADILLVAILDIFIVGIALFVEEK